MTFVDPDGLDYHVCIDGRCGDFSDGEFQNFLRRFQKRYKFLAGSGRILDLEADRIAGTARWFDGAAARRSTNAARFVEWFVATQTTSAAAEFGGGSIKGLGAGRASQEAFKGGIRIQGRVAEHIARATLGFKGYKILGEQVRVATSKGVRVVDFLVEKGGEIVAVEVKSGAATRTAGQLAKDAAMASEGGLIGLGKGRESIVGLTDSVRKIKTIEVHPF